MMTRATWLGGVIYLFFCGAAIAQTSLNSPATSESFAMGVMVILGVQVVVVLIVAARLQRWIKEQVDTRLREDDSAFGRHRLDPLAHEPMRRQLAVELRDEFAGIRSEIVAANKNHRDEMRNLTEVFKPIVEQNTFAMKSMASQMRRRPMDDDDGDPGDRTGGNNRT